MPNNHSKYCIPGVTRVGTPAGLGLDRDHGSAGVHSPGPLAGEPLYFDSFAGEKLIHGHCRLLRRNTGKDHLPLGCLQREGGKCCRILGHLDHVDSVWQGRVKPLPHLGSGASPGQGQLQVLSLACCPGWGRASVGDLRVWCEPRRISDGHPCPSNSPLYSTRDVPVAGETHPASFSVPDNQMLSHGEHTRRTRRREAGHVAAVPADTTVSGSSVRPVGRA
jgi:hypothetical protein